MFENAKLITHKNCMDGCACALLFISCGGKRENISFCSPNHLEVDEVVMDLVENYEDSIILADISISQELAEKINLKRNDVLLFDHHKSAIPLSKYSWCFISKENTKCGSMVFYDWLKSSGVTTSFKYHDLVRMVDDQDRWIKSDEYSEKLSLLHNFLGQNLFIDRFLENPYVYLSVPEQYALRIEDKKRDDYIKNKLNEVEIVEKNINGNLVKIGFVLSSTHQSMLGHEICNKKGTDIAVIVGQSISLRASEMCPVDLSVVANLNGGGGHSKASGVSYNKMLGTSLLEFVKNNLKFE